MIEEYVLSEVSKYVPSIFRFVNKHYKDLKFKVEKDLGIIYENYLSFSYKKYITVKTLLYKNEGKKLYDFYEHVHLKKDDRLNDDGAIIKTDNTERIFDEFTNVIITGTGGIGKSMLVKHIFINQIEQATSIPVFIDLKALNDWDNENSSLEHFIYTEAYNHKLVLEEEYFIATLKSGAYTILFDGLDEVISSKRPWLDKEIKDFTNIYNSNRFVISSRPSDEFIGWDNFIEYKMKPLSKDQAVALINRIEYDNAIKRKFKKELKENLYEKHRSFASIPLLLTIMLMTYETGSGIPNNLTDFYNQAFYTLYQRHDASKSGFKRELKGNLAPEEFKNLLSYISMKTFFSSQVDFDEGIIDSLIKNYIQKNSSIKITTSNFIYDALNSSCMLIQEGTHFKFCHRSFQEFFAALGIAQLDDIRQRKILVHWIEYDFNTIISHKTFMDTLFSNQKDRTYMNLCVPIIEKMDLILKEKSIEEVIIDVFNHFICRVIKKQETISFSMSSEYRAYFHLQFTIFLSLNLNVSEDIDDPESMDFKQIICSEWEKNEEKNYNDLPENEKILLQEWINSWYIKRHNYLRDWAETFKKANTTRKRSFQTMIDEI